MTPTAAFFAFIVVLFTQVPAKAQGAYNVLPGEESVALMQSESGKASKAASKAITVSIKDLPLAEALDYIARQAQMRVAYAKDIPGLSDKLSLELKNVRLREVLNKALSGKHLTAVFASDGETIVIQRDTGSTVNTTGGAQGRKVVSGRVVDSASKEGLQGVAVVLKGSNLHAVTDKKGNFVLMGVSSDPSQIITFKLLGYRSQSRSFEIGDGKQIKLDDVSLAQSASVMSEVVTTATGMQKRVEVANDIVKVNVDEVMQRSPIRSMTDLLQHAQVPGVLVTPSSGDPGAPARIRIRGIGSISQSNDPVVIIDGVWIDASSDRLSRLDEIDPSIIESMEIVRGPSAATLYGQEASNGVIIITTRQGRAGPTRWNFSYNRDWGDVPGDKPLEYRGYGRLVTSNVRRSCNIENVIDYQCVQDSIAIRDPNHPLLLGEGGSLTNRHTLSVDGGAKAVRYALNGVLQDQLGPRRIPEVDLVRMRMLDYSIKSAFLKPSNLSRRNITAKFNMSPDMNLDLGILLSGNQTILRDNSYRNFYGSTDPHNLDTVVFLSGENDIQEHSNNNSSFSALMSLQANWRPLSWLHASGQAGVERVSMEAGTSQFGQKCFVGNCVESAGTGLERHDNISVYTVRTQMALRPTLGWLDRLVEIRPALGADLRKNSRSGIRINRTDIPPGERTINSGTISGAEYIQRSTATGGWYVNATVGIFKRLYFDTGIRQDIGSGITSSSNAIYPKLGSSWVISDESFWPMNDMVSTLRLRAAFGHAAVQPDITDIHGKYVAGQARIGGKTVQIATLDGIGNLKIRPERATELEVGFDSDLLRDRVHLGFTFVHKENRNNLVLRPMPPSVGLANSMRKENIARVMNRAVEMSVTARALDMENVLLSITYNLSVLDNQVAKLGDGISPFNATGSASNNRIAEGYPIGGIWSLPILGYHDVDGDGMLNSEEVILGDTLVYIGWGQPRQRANYGFSLTLNNLITFDARLTYQGNYVQSMKVYSGEGLENIKAPLSEQATARASQLSRGRPISDLRFNSASVTYVVPKSILNRFNARSFSISLQGSNLALWTKYRGRDPGVNSALYSEGLEDNGAVIPQPRQYVLNFRWGI